MKSNITISLIPEVEFTLIQADQIVRYNSDSNALCIKCMLSGRAEQRSVTPRQAAAIIALAIGGDDDLPDNITKALYDIAEPVMDGLSNDTRPIP